MVYKRAQRPAAQDMNMQVRHFLVTMGSVIEEEPVSRIGNAGRAGDMARGPRERQNLGVAGVGGKIVERDVSPLWHHQNMRRSLRVDIQNGQDMVVLVNFGGGDFSAMPLTPSRAASTS